MLIEELGFGGTPRVKVWWFLGGMVVALASAPLSAAAAAAPMLNSPADLTELSLEELMRVEVTSVSKRAEPLFTAPSAVTVMTSEDIRRLGAQSLPEILRYIPGFSVGRINALQWDVTARGFGGRFANKLLVLVDGMSVYSPGFSGVYWEAQDTLLADIDRIEVIRGPGGTLWGANAVNGVINIVTKSATQTQGGLVTAGAGSELRAMSQARYGGSVGPTAWRVWTKYQDHDAGWAGEEGEHASDDWRGGRVGYRTDTQLGEQDKLMTHGEFYNLNLGTRLTTYPVGSLVSAFERNDEHYSGFHTLSRWTHQFSEKSDAMVKGYFDQTREADFGLTKAITRTIDLEAQHRFPLFWQQDIVWGLGYRYVTDHRMTTDYTQLIPDNRGVNLFSAFFQDEIPLLDDRVRLTLGSKLEHNDYSGFEMQPNARLAWLATPSQTLWAAVSRAVRTPNRAEADVIVVTANNGNGTFSAAVGDQEFGSEQLLATEMGHRIKLSPRLMMESAAYYNHYRGVLGQVLGVGTQSALGRILVPLLFRNTVEAQTWGFELSGDWRPFDFWRLVPGFTLQRIWAHQDPKGAVNNGEVSIERGTPKQAFFLRSILDLPWHLELDTALRAVGKVPHWRIGDYASLDVRLGWRPTEALECALIAQDLIEPHHKESDSAIYNEMTEVERSILAQVTWRF